MSDIESAVAPLRFLIVEDHGFQRWAIGRTLQSLGAVHIISTENGEQALDAFRSAEPPVDIVITDLNMPGMDGLEFIRHVGEGPLAPALIVVSEQDRSVVASVRTMASAYGVTLLDAIQKPLTNQKLAAALARYDGSRNRAASHKAREYPFEEIRDAIHKGQFEPYYQPKLDLTTGALKGAEVLARWIHPEDGLVHPAAFIGVLETHGEIDALTMQLLERAAHDYRTWRVKAGQATFSINVSLKMLADITLSDRLMAVLAAKEIEPRFVILEVTETAAATHMGKALENLSRLRMLGFGLSIDDFGTGYSSMEQLTRIPFTELKIDQTFVRNAAANQLSRTVLSSSLDIARQLKLVAVAEGVETVHEVELLRQLECPIGQGFLLGRPMAGGDFLAWVARSYA